jgi:MFS family permease
MNLYQTRDFGEKINATIQYAVKQIRSLGMALLYIAGAPALVAGIVTGIASSSMLSTQPAFGDRTGMNSWMFQQFSSPYYIVAIVLAMFIPLLVNLTVYSHLKIYNRTQGEPVTAEAVWAEVQNVFGQAIMTWFVVGFLVILSTVFLFIPGIYVGVVFSLALPVIVFEDASVSTFISRCFDLIRDKWWSTFGLIIIISFIAYILSFAFNVPAAAVNMMVALKLVPHMPVYVTILTSILGTVGNVVVSSLIALGIAFQYFNLVELRDGRSILSAIDSIGSSTPPPIPRSNDEGDY